MRAFPQSAPAMVRLSVDEGAIVVGLLDFLVEPTMRASPDVIGLAMRTRRRVSAALAGAISGAAAELDDRFEQLRGDFHDMQDAFRDQVKRVEDTLATTAELRSIARQARELVGDHGPVEIDEQDVRLQRLRADLARIAA